MYRSSGIYPNHISWDFLTISKRALHVESSVWKLNSFLTLRQHSGLSSQLPYPKIVLVLPDHPKRTPVLTFDKSDLSSIGILPTSRYHRRNKTSMIPLLVKIQGAVSCSRSPGFAKLRFINSCNIGAASLRPYKLLYNFITLSFRQSSLNIYLGSTTNTGRASTPFEKAFCTSKFLPVNLFAWRY